MPAFRRGEVVLRGAFHPSVGAGRPEDLTLTRRSLHYRAGLICDNLHALERFSL